jgi:hypothetical protein
VLGFPGSDPWVAITSASVSTAMRLLRNSLLVALAVALCALLVPAASMSGPIEDCADDGQLQGNYSDQQKQQALKDLPSDLSEYSDCGEILNTPNPRRPGAGGGTGGGDRPGSGGGGSGSGAGASAATEQSTSAAKPSRSELARRQRERARRQRERAAIDALANGGGKPNLKLDGKAISPGDAGLYNLAAATHEVPTPIKLALIAVALLAIAGIVVAARRRFPQLFDRLSGTLTNLGHVARLRR